MPNLNEPLAATDLRQVVCSPEQVALDLPIAGPTSRILAYGLDALVILVIEVGVFALGMLSAPLAQWLASWLQGLAEGVSQGHTAELENTILALMAALVLVEFVIELGYFVIAEQLMSGRSPGKALVGLRVVRDGGLPISLRDSLVRNLFRAVDILPSSYLVGLMAMLASRQGKRLGDLAAGTIVIRLDRPEVSSPLPPPSAADLMGFRFERAQISRLGPIECELIRRTLRRLPALQAEAADAALQHSAEALRQRIGYTGEIAAGEREAFLRALLHLAEQR